MAGEAAEINEVYVAPGHRRQGVGRKLVEQMRRLLFSRVSNLTTIRAKADRNDVAGRAFWQALGYENWVWSLLTIGKLVESTRFQARSPARMCRATCAGSTL